MNESSVDVIALSDLSDEDLASIKKAQLDAFPSGKLGEINRALVTSSYAFLLRGKEKDILASALLHPLYIKGINSRYKIYVIASVVSTVRGKGYGRLIMSQVNKFLEREHLVAIGFCNLDKTIFYEKVGWAAYHDVAGRFLRIKKDGTIKRHKEDSDLLVYDKGGEFSKDLLGMKGDVFFSRFPIV